MKRLNVAVVGAGYWGKKITGEYSALSRDDPSVRLFGVCDLLNENLQYCRDRFAVPYVTNDYRDLLSSSAVDAVNICTPNETHYTICRDTLESGKHALVEKPMTLSFVEALRLVELARKKNLVLCVGHIFRFNNALAKLRELMREGFFGDIFYTKLQWTTWITPLPGRDIIHDLAPHPFDILNLLLDKWPAKITCKAKSYRRDQLEEMASLVAEFDSDAMALVELSWLLPEKKRDVTVVGSKRTAKVNCLTQKMKVFEKERSFGIRVDSNDAMVAELRHFAECVRNNGLDEGPQIRNSGMVGAYVVRMLEAATKSLRENRTIPTNLTLEYA